MMRKILMVSAAAVLVVLCTGFYSCKPSPGKADAYYNSTLDYHEAVLEKEDVLIQIINHEMNKPSIDSVNTNPSQQVDTSSDIEALDLAFADFCLQIKESESGLLELGGFHGDDKLLSASLSLIRMYSKLSENEYKELTEIVKIPTVLYTNENDNRFLDLNVHIDTCLQNEIDNFTRVCKEFSREYKFTLVERP